MRRETLDPCALIRGHGARISTDERVGHELADSREELRTHRRMETFRVAGADRQNSQSALRSQRRERNGADLDRVLAEQIVALRVADLCAAGLARLQEGLERLDIHAGKIIGAQE